MRTLREQCAKLPRKCAKLRTAEFLGKGIYLAIGQALQNLRISSRNRNGFLDIVDRSELIVNAGADLPMTRTSVATERILAEDDVAALFGIEMAPGPLAPGVEETKKNGRSVQAAPARRVISSGIPPAGEPLARKKRPTKKKKMLTKKRSGIDQLTKKIREVG